MDRKRLAKHIGQVRGRDTQLEFAQKFGVSRQTVIRWEKGKAVPPERVLKTMGIRMEFVEAK